MHRDAFARQFLLAPVDARYDALHDWRPVRVDDAHVLYVHPLLATQVADIPGCRLIGLGVFIDPLHVDADDGDIVLGLARRATSFADLEQALALLGGRWVLLARIAGETRLYHDATGLKAAYFVTGRSCRSFAGSHPQLFARLGITVRDDALVQQFEAHTHSGSWPIGVVPYAETHQLLPNHYLDVRTMSAHRYWPVERLTTLDRDTAASEMLDLLQRLIDALRTRRACVMNLTGGYDSRLLLAASKAHWHELEFFTLKGAWIPHHDVSIARRLARACGLRHTFVTFDTEHDSTAIAQRGQESIGGLWYDAAIPTLRAEWDQVGQRYLLQGLVSEVTRCFYAATDGAASAPHAAGIAHLAGFAKNPVAERGFGEWLAGLPATLPIDLYDLLYWEHRIGVWAATGMTLRDTAIDAIPPMNCRRYLEIGLSVDRTQRRHPHPLIERMIELAAPELLRFDFNHDWVDALKARIGRTPLLWRWHKYLK